MKLLSLAAAITAVACAARPALSQESGPVREAVEVSLVEVPVRVLDRDGKPVRGLTEKDFTLLDEGRSQKIIGFDAIDLTEKVEASAAHSVPPAARRRFLVLFDFSFAHPKAILEARRAAKEFVLSGLGENDLAAVATYSVEKGVRLLVTFSSDRATLARAIETLGFEAHSTGDPLAFAFGPVGPLPTGLSPIAETKNAELTEMLQTMGSLSRARDDDYTRGRVRHLIQSLRGLGEALDAVAGRKDVIYLSEGFNGRYLVGTRESDQEQQWLVHGEPWKVDADKRFGNTPLRNELADMGEILRRSDCVIHAVDIAGIRSEADPDTASVARRETENSLFEIANVTGGEVFRNANDMSTQLGRLVSQTSLVYVLTFRPDRAGTEGKFHALKVKVGVPGAHVSARAGYFERKGFKQLAPIERSLSAANVIASEIPVDDIPMRLLAVPFASGAAAASVPVLLEIPGERFLAGDEAGRVTAEIYVYAIDQDNVVRDFFVQTLGLDVARNRERLRSGGLKYYGELALPPGDYRLRALVRNADTGRMGFSVSSLHVPSFAGGEPYLLPPVFLESSAAWMSVRGRGTGAGGGVEPSSYPLLSLPGEGQGPAALPLLEAGTASRVCILAYHFGAPGGSDDLRVGSQILASDGRPLQAGALEIVGRTVPKPDGRRTLVLSFTTPSGLAPGRYGLRVFLQDGPTGQARQASAPFLVR